MIPHLAWSVISTVKTNFIIWETRDRSWKPANFSTKPLAETQWKRADTFKSTEALRKHETMPPFSSYTFPVETVLRKRNGILNHQVSATFPNCGNTLFHPVVIFKSRCKFHIYHHTIHLEATTFVKSKISVVGMARWIIWKQAYNFKCIIGLQTVGLLDFLINLYTVTIINPH